MRHPANVERYDNRTFGQRVADFVAEKMGSWPFILTQTGILIGWMIYNGYVALHLLHHKPFDPFPWLLLNICLSLQAAYAAPILQLSQNRQADHDRSRAESDYEVNQKALTLILEIHEHVTR